jgi:hypothetical protein
MNVLLIIVGVVAPLLPIVLFPTRFFGKGMGMTLLGAGLLVAAIMLVWWSINFSTDATTSTDTDTAAATGLSDADMSALEKLF